MRAHVAHGAGRSVRGIRGIRTRAAVACSRSRSRARRSTQPASHPPHPHGGMGHQEAVWGASSLV